MHESSKSNALNNFVVYSIIICNNFHEESIVHFYFCLSTDQQSEILIELSINEENLFI